MDSQLRGRARRSVLAFSFGLNVDGSPGTPNRQLATILRSRLEDGNIECVLAQWEIADALYELGGITLPADHVAWPGRVSSADVTDPFGIVQRLDASHREGSAEAFVIGRIGRKPSGLDSARRQGELAKLLNRVTMDPRVSMDFLRQVRERPSLPALRKGSWTEHRGWPDPGARGLLAGQARRLNRLILESVFADALAGSRYLSTSELCGWMVSTLSSFEHWTVVAHPNHQPRCREGLRRAAAAADHAPRIDLMDCAEVGYDPRSAQTWTRSRESFRRYEDELGRASRRSWAGIRPE